MGTTIARQHCNSDYATKTVRQPTTKKQGIRHIHVLDAHALTDQPPINSLAEHPSFRPHQSKEIKPIKPFLAIAPELLKKWSSAITFKR